MQEKGLLQKQRQKGKWIGIITISGTTIFLVLFAFNIWKVRNRKSVEIINHKKIPVQICIVKKRKLNELIETTGNFIPLQQVKIYPRIPGKIIKKIMVQTGDEVKKGQLIAELEKSEIKARLNRARAQIELAAANRDVLKKDFLRIKNLVKHKAASRQKADHVHAELKAAAARLKEAKAAFKELEVIYNEYNIFATIPGIVTDRYLDTGSFSNPGIPIIGIANERILKLVTTVSEPVFPKIQKGMKINFHTDAFPEKVFSGEIFTVYPSLDPATRTAKIEIRVENSTLALRSGMFAHVKIHLGEKTALTVPLDGLIKMSGTGNYYAFTVSNGKAHLKNIKTGIIQNNLVEILSGLKQGDKMVVKGQRQIKDGTDVEIINRGSKYNHDNGE